MSDPHLDRYQWLKAVLQAEGLSPTAKNVASALVLEWANKDTGQVNPEHTPTQEDIADYLKVHQDTVKRVMRELRNAGWLMTLGHGGRSKAPQIRLVSPGKIISFADHKGGANDPCQSKKGGAIYTGRDSKRGDDLQGKGGEIIPPHYKKHYRHCNARATEGPPDAVLRFMDTQFLGSAVRGPTLVAMSDHETLNRYSEIVRSEGLPDLHEFPIWQRSAKQDFAYLPCKRLDTPEKVDQAICYLRTLMDHQAARYAAQRSNQ